ncbi:hypothetical protein [Streptomyces sp. 1222.5]|uniref:hypothetical protein n=1 Tax=Streptomyces sp. 1222.5 TaxID=1881026 RepID=UPI003D74F98A
MSRTLFLALVLPILAAECVAQFALHDQTWTTVCALLGLAVVAIRWACGPRTADEQCAADCPKCAESRSDER